MSTPDTPLFQRAIHLDSEAATDALACLLSGIVRSGDIIALRGDLGAGKTAFARAFISAAMGRPEEVPSPTFTLLQVYETPQLLIHHFDLYRLESPEDALELGIEDAFADGVSLIEWPERLGPWLPAQRLDLELLHAEQSEHRRAILSSDDESWHQRLTALDAWDKITDDVHHTTNQQDT